MNFVKGIMESPKRCSLAIPLSSELDFAAVRPRSWAFRPAAKKEVVLDLPDVLPELEDVANLRWRHSEGSLRTIAAPRPPSSRAPAELWVSLRPARKGRVLRLLGWLWCLDSTAPGHSVRLTYI